MSHIDIIIAAALCYLAGFSGGMLFGEKLVNRIRRWLWPAKCEICGLNATTVHIMTRMNAELDVSTTAIVLCDSCADENAESIKEEFSDRAHFEESE